MNTHSTKRALEIVCTILTLSALPFPFAHAIAETEETAASESLDGTPKSEATSPQDGEHDQEATPPVREILGAEAEGSAEKQPEIMKDLPQATPEPTPSPAPVTKESPKVLPLNQKGTKNETPKEKDQASAPLQPAKKLPTKVDIETYTVPSEIDLLASIGLSKTSPYESAIRLLETRLRSHPRSSERKNYNKHCERVLKDVREFYTPGNLNTLACLPYRVENTFRESAKAESPRASPRITTRAQWLALADATLSESWSKLKFSTREELLQLMTFFRDTPSICPFRNAGIALVSHAESLLPDEAIVGVTEEIYQKTADCLKPEEEGYERAHLRAGLHRLGRDDEAGAKVALKKALLAKNPKEKYRTLFWLGATETREQEAQGQRSSGTPYWTALLKEAPFEIHSIIAAKVLNKDPLENLLDNGKPMLAARASSDDWNNPSNAIAFVTELLLARKNHAALNSWFNTLTTVPTTKNPDSLLFLGLAANRAQQYLPSIIFLTRYLRETPVVRVNMEFLRTYFPIPYAKEILANTRKVDPVLIFALVRQESAFNPNARSGANARGLMQLLPTTARLFERVRPTSLHDVNTNTRIGVRYIESLMKTYQGKAEHVLSAYNAGPMNINRWQVRYPVEQDLLFSDLIPFKETRGYVSSILRNAYWYGRLLTARQDAIGTTTLQKSAQSEWRSTVVHNLLEIAWNNRAETAKELKNIKELFRLSKTDLTSPQRNKNSVVQEFPPLSNDPIPATRQ
jgi:soluble lytic murein transglycosylase